MAKARRLEDVLVEVAALRADPSGTEVQARLRQILRTESSHAVVEVAAVVETYALAALAPALAEAFDRFMIDPEQTDKACRAKEAIAKALVNTATGYLDLYLRGITWRQQTPVWGGTEDTAAGLRGVCAAGLVLEMAPDDALLEVAPLLADPETPARSGAVQALVMLGGAGAEAVLRFKASLGDDEHTVVEACFAGVLDINPSALPYVARFLDAAPGEQAAAAAFALGGSRRPEAFAPLRSWWERTLSRTDRRVALFAMADLRVAEATAYLLARLEEEPIPTAQVLVEALGVHAAYDEALYDRLLRAAESRDDPRLVASVRQVRHPKR